MATPIRPIDYDAIRRALVGAMCTITGLDQGHVIMAEPEAPNFPRPSLPYLSFKVTSAAIKYGDDIVQMEGNIMHAGGQRGMVLSVNSYGRSHEDAYGLMAMLQAGLDLPPILDTLRAAGIAVWRQGAVGDLSMLLETGFEGRAQMDVFCGIAANTSIAAGSIESVSVTGSVDTGRDIQAVDIETEGQ